MFIDKSTNPRLAEIIKALKKAVEAGPEAALSDHMRHCDCPLMMHGRALVRQDSCRGSKCVGTWASHVKKSGGLSRH
jgi:hypothetical protein